MTATDRPFADPHEVHLIRPSSATASASDSSAGGGDNVVDLLKQLVGQGSHLAEQQLSLIKAEIRESTNDLKAAVGAMAGAAVVGLAGLGVVLMGLAYLLGDAIENTPLATLIVGLATLALAYVLYSIGAKKMSASNLTPDRTQRTLQRDVDAARGNLNTEQTR
jgi:uncharacterized membrane protein YqjE